ncbi:MAG: tRNA (cytidine(56)-2'-O)-methyltransferase [Thermoplasmata archaeon]
MATASSGSSRRPKREPRPDVSVLRVGHRAGRDPRLTTHVALTARAFGATRMYLHPPDPELSARLAGVADRWGGPFAVEGVEHWREFVRAWDGAIVHLTMYGIPIDRAAPRIRRHARVLIVVGGAKVPPQLYHLASYNVAVGHQPHSEVAALAIALYRVLGAPAPWTFRGAKHRIVPSARGKQVLPARRVRG